MKYAYEVHDDLNAVLLWGCDGHTQDTFWLEFALPTFTY